MNGQPLLFLYHGSSGGLKLETLLFLQGATVDNNHQKGWTFITLQLILGVLIRFQYREHLSA